MRGLRRWLLPALVSAAVHLPGLSSPPLDYHYHRQVNTASIARNYHQRGLPLLEPQIDWEGPAPGRAATEMPLYMYLVGALWGVFGLGDLWGRVLSLLFSSATAALLLVFLERWLPRREALFSAQLFSAIPLEVYFGRTIQPEAFALLCTIAALLCLDLHLESRSPASWAGAWAAASLAIGHKLPYAYLLGVCAVLAWARLGSGCLRRPALWCFFPAVAGSVFAWYKHASAGVYVVPTRGGELLGILHYDGLPRFLRHQILSRFPELAVGWPGMALWLAGVSAVRGAKLKLLLWGWFACVWAYLAAGGHYTFAHEYTALPLALVNAAFMGIGLGRLSDAARSARQRAALAVLLLSLPAYAFGRIRHWYRVERRFLTAEAAAAADKVSGKDDLFVCDDRSSSAYLYYLGRRGWGSSFQELPDPWDWIQQKKRAGARFLAAPKDGILAEPAHPVSRLIRARFPLLYESENLLIFRIQ